MDEVVWVLVLAVWEAEVERLLESRSSGLLWETQ